MGPTCICARCGSEKDLPLGRCPSCAHLPEGPDRELAVVCSSRVLDAAVLQDAQARIRRGEPVRPTAALLARARAVLAGGSMVETRLSGARLVGIAAACLLLTPLVGYALAWHHRNDAGPVVRQILVVTVPISLLLFAALVAWRAWGVVALG